MKSKRILQLVACACMMATATQVKAAGEDSVAFNPHWDLRLQGGAAYTLGETKFKDLISPAVAIYGAYRFTPVWGLRAGLSGYESKGAMMKSVYKYNYLQGNVDVVVDGRFVQAQADSQLHWRGSANQRVIDVGRTRASQEVVLL